MGCGTSAGVDDAATDTSTPDASDASDASDAGASDAPPTYDLEFVASDTNRCVSRSDNGGSVTFGAPNASAADDAVVELLFKGNAALQPGANLGPKYATEIATAQTLHYGTYRARLQLGHCAPTEELVNGVFTYFNDGADHDGDGLIDNSEIDIEVLCSDPSILSLTIWTEYTSSAAGQFKNANRVIHTSTGAYTDKVDGTLIGNNTSLAFQVPGFPDPNAFYEMGFDWDAGAIRYFILFDGKTEVTLWQYQDATHVPTLAAPFLFNLWHSTDWWNSAGADQYPANDATLRVDWLRYWAR